VKGIASRPDYEVPVKACFDYLVSRPEVDPERIAVIGISMAGYYAPRAVAFEPRGKAYIGWSGWYRVLDDLYEFCPNLRTTVRRLLGGVTDEQALRQAEEAIAAYFEVQIKARRENPGEDLVSFLIAARAPDGAPFSDRQVLGALRLLLVAGIDTTWSAIGSSLWHLATHEQDRARLVAAPELIPTAVEEFLRAYAPVTMAREVARTTDVGGCPMREGQMVLLSFPAANRDPEKFPDADKVLIDRKHNPHAAFGLGIHRCIGSNLARMEMVVALQEWLKRIPAFSLDSSKATTWSQGTVRGPRNLPIRIG